MSWNVGPRCNSASIFLRAVRMARFTSASRTILSDADMSTETDWSRGSPDRYNIRRLVYFEVYDSIRDAIQREKNMKHWPRVWKTRLIAQSNPDMARSVRRDFLT